MTNTIPAPPTQPIQQGNSRATTSLVLGIVSLFINPLAITTTLGIIFGVLGVRASGVRGGRSKAIGGIVLSVVGFFAGIIIFFSIVSAISSAGSTVDGSLATPAAAPVTASATTKAAAPTRSVAPTRAAAPATKAPSAAAVPAEYLNALAQAKAYDSTAHLSKKGLLDQLTSSYGGQFPRKAAAYAVDHVGADWNANALAQAKQYEQTAHLSNAALHDQLVSAYGGQFTESQADYAIKHVND